MSADITSDRLHHDLLHSGFAPGCCYLNPEKVERVYFSPSLQDRREAWRAHCADAVARISWNGLIWKRSRVELGLLILDGLRTRHARDTMIRAMGVPPGGQVSF